MSLGNRAGWRYDSVRHSLAARGISSGRKFSGRKYLYMPIDPSDRTNDIVVTVKKSPNEGRSFKPLAGTAAQRLTEKADVSEKRALRSARAPLENLKNIATINKMTEENAFREMLDQKALYDAELGRYTANVQQVLAGDAGPEAVAALKTQIRMNARVKARIGEPLTELEQQIVREGEQKNIFGVTVKSGAEKDIEEIEAQRAREREGGVKRFGRELGTATAVETADVIAETPGAVGSALKNVYDEQKGLKGGSGLIGREEEAVQSPFFRTNALIGNEEDGAFRPDGWDVKKQLNGDSLPGMFDRMAGVKGQKVPTHIERSMKEVQSVYANKGKMADVDVSSYERGVKAFEKGDREQLIRAITDLEGQEEMMKDRYYLLEQTRAEILNPRNRVSAYHQDKGFLGFIGGGDGASKLADATKKYNEVKVGVKKSNNELFARRKLLQYKLSRLDAAVPAETGVPGDIRVVGGSEGGGLRKLADDATAPAGFTGRVLREGRVD